MTRWHQDYTRWKKLVTRGNPPYISKKCKSKFNSWRPESFSRCCLVRGVLSTWKTKMTRWWFQILFIFTRILGEIDPIWWTYCSNGLVKNHQPDYKWYVMICSLVQLKKSWVILPLSWEMFFSSPMAAPNLPWQFFDKKKRKCFTTRNVKGPRGIGNAP